ncbi:MAG: hypothetical protein U0974_11500 [Gemmatimonadales bacterium]|nr:hypothetical protein [Gemmatimonadales bacterium]
MAFLVLRPDDHSPAPLPDGEALALPPGTIFALPASLWAIEEDLETFAALVSRHPWIPAVIIEDGTAAPRGLGSEARYLLAGCCDVRRVVPPPPPTHTGGGTRGPRPRPKQEQPVDSRDPTPAHGKREGAMVLDAFTSSATMTLPFARDWASTAGSAITDDPG